MVLNFTFLSVQQDILGNKTSTAAGGLNFIGNVRLSTNKQIQTNKEEKKTLNFNMKC